MKKFLIGLLVIGMIFLSGCVEQPEEKAKQLADGTDEGIATAALAQSLTKIEYCTMNELVSKVEEIYAEQGMGEFDPSDEEMATTEALLESAKECKHRVEKSASKISESEYLVSYSFISSADCQQPGMGFGGEEFIQIEVNIAAGTTNVIKGAFNENQKQELQNRIQQIEGMGNCGSLMMMGTVSSSPAPVR